MDLRFQIDPDTLKELYEVRIPEVKAAIRDCRNAAGKYAMPRGCDTVLIRRAQTVCEKAYAWTRKVVARYRGDQFHLGGNTPTALHVRPRLLCLTQMVTSVCMSSLCATRSRVKATTPLKPRLTSCSPSISPSRSPRATRSSGTRSVTIMRCGHGSLNYTA